MRQDLFKYLPSEIINDILLRLPVRAIAISKCVCRSWLDLLKTDYFVKSHLSTSAAALAILMNDIAGNPSRCSVFELEDEIDVENSHDHSYKHLTKFDFPHRVRIEGSANGLLFLHKYREALYVCNPISREYIELYRPQEFVIPIEIQVVYGFGVSKISGQHKVVRIIPHSDCHHVYTLGTGSWRRVEAASASFSYTTFINGAFLNGNLHWLVSDSNNTWWISCFDLETERFSTFSVSHVPTFSVFPVPGDIPYVAKVSVLRDCLCLCDHTSVGNDIIIIWLMKEYGVEKSWTKEYVINLTHDYHGIFRHLCRVTPIKVIKDGDILMESGQMQLCYFSNNTKTTQELVHVNGRYYFLDPVLLTPSFLSLKSFGMENVISL